MSSNLKIPKTCEFCGKPFIAKQMRTRFCSSNCAHKFSLKEKDGAHMEIPDNQANPVRLVPERPYISVSEASKILGISQDTIRRQIINGIIPAFNLGERLTRIDRQALEELFRKDLVHLVNSHGKNPAGQGLMKASAVEGYYTISDIAGKYNIPNDRVYAIINKYNLAKKKVGRYIYVQKDEADALFAEYKKLFDGYEKAFQNKSHSPLAQKRQA